MKWSKALITLTLATQVHAATSTSTGMLGVVNKMDDTASFIRLATGETETVSVGRLPHEIVFDGNGYAYVSNYGSNHIRSSALGDDPGNTLSVIKLSEPYTVVEIDLGPSRCAPHGLTASRDGRHLYVTCEARQEILVIDLQSQTVSHMLRTNQAGSHLLVVSSDDSRAYVSNFWHGTVSVFDLSSRKLIQQINTGRGCEGIGLSNDDRSLYITRVEEGEVLRIDTRSFKVVQRRKLAEGSAPIRVNNVPADSSKIVVNDVASGKMLVLNADDLSTVREISLGKQPIGLAVSNDARAFAANMRDNNISVINLNSGQTEATYATGRAPDGIAFQP